MHFDKAGCDNSNVAFTWPSNRDRASAIKIATNPVSGGIYNDPPGQTYYYARGAPWTHHPGPFPRAYGANVSYSNVAGSRAGITFTGSRITRIYSMSSNRSSETIYLDGVSQGTRSSYAPESRWQVGRTWEVPYGTHVIEVQANGNGYSDLDAFVVDTVVHGSGSYDNPPAQIQYMGNGPTWTHATGWPSAFNGTVSWSNEVQDGATFTFTGNQVTYWYTKASNRGKAAITIDGVDKGYVDLYSASTVWQASTPFPNLGAGVHTLNISVSGLTSGSGTFVDVDRITVP